jgi:hypothetical protein
MVHGIWKFGFARVNNTCITFVHNSIYHKSESVASLTCEVSFTSNWQEPERDFNVTCRLKSNSCGLDLIVPAWFGVNAIELREPRPFNADDETKATPSLDWYEKRRSDIEEKLLDLLLASFKYEHRLSGVQANSFFGHCGSRHQVEIAAIRGQPVLVVKML